MEQFLRSRRPTIVCKDPTSANGNSVVVTSNPPMMTNEWLSNDYLTVENYEHDPAYDRYLRSRKPIVVSTERFAPESCVLIAPMNTNLDFSALRYRSMKEAYDNDTETAANAAKQFVIPPLNTDIRFSSVLPFHKPLLAIDSAAFNELHPHKPHVHETNAENFSWAVVTAADSPEIVAKKKLIHPIQNQRLCGSCWNSIFGTKKTRFVMI